MRSVLARGDEMGSTRTRATRAGGFGPAWLLGAWMVGACAFLADPARACSCFDPASSLDLVLPADGAANVPRNTRVFLGGKQVLVDEAGAFRDPPPLALVDADGHEVPSRASEIVGVASVFVLHPEELLEEGRSYTVVVGDRPLARFTVGDVVDQGAPTPPRVVGVESESELEFLPLGVSDSCGPSAGARFGLEGVDVLALAALDEAAALDDDAMAGEVSVVATGPVVSVGRFACEQSWPEARPLASANVRFATYDLAGNFSGWSDARGVILPPPGCRCSAAHAARASTPLAGVALVLVVTSRLLAARRRRATSRGARR